MALSRRDFLNVLKYVVGTALASLAGNYYLTRFEPSWVDVTRINIPIRGLPEAFSGYRILQVSDIHIGGWMDKERLANVVDIILAEKPDLVAATGDFLIGTHWNPDLDGAAWEFLEVMTPLAQAHKVVAVMGNHDHWTDVERVRTMLSMAGILELRNDVHALEKDGEKLYLAGVDDIYVNAQDLNLVLAKLPEGVPTILLAHEPDYADVTAETGRFHFQLSGHSHGGQVVLPFGSPVVLPEWGRKYPAGLYNLGNMLLYTNRGVGMTSPFVRFNCRPEITVFTLYGAG